MAQLIEADTGLWLWVATTDLEVYDLYLQARESICQRSRSGSVSLEKVLPGTLGRGRTGGIIGSGQPVGRSFP
ncbi:MAG: hypothetical protein ACNA8J_08680 [Gammaproteobacteria bacterium]